MSKNDSDYRKRLCEICGEETSSWTIKRRYVFVKNRIIEKDITFCENCIGLFDDMAIVNEVQAVNSYLLLKAPKLLKKFLRDIEMPDANSAKEWGIQDMPRIKLLYGNTVFRWFEIENTSGSKRQFQVRINDKEGMIWCKLVKAINSSGEELCPRCEQVIKKGE